MKKQFQFNVDLETLLDMDGIEGLNNHLDDAMSAAGLTEMATDIAYKVVGLEGETIIVEATYTPEEEYTPLYNIGDEVYWTDPAEGLSSGYYKVVSVSPSSEEDTIYTISNGSSEAEVYESELS